MLDTFPIVVASAVVLFAGLVGCASSPSSSSTSTSTSTSPASDGSVGSAEHLEILTSDGTQEACKLPTPMLSVPSLTFILDVSTSALALVRTEACAAATGEPPSTTKRVTVSERERNELVTLVRALTVVTAVNCGADGTTTRVTATRQGTATSWYDDAPGTCFKGQQALAHDGVDALLTKLNGLLK
jgi:hypothetical protein